MVLSKIRRTRARAKACITSQDRCGGGIGADGTTCLSGNGDCSSWGSGGGGGGGGWLCLSRVYCAW